MYGTILVPTDGSEGATDAAEHALDIASNYGATVHAIYVVTEDSATRAVQYDFGSFGEDVRDGLLRAMQEEGEEATGRIADRGAQLGVDVVTAIISGISPPHDEILAYAADHDVDLLVMGSHGRSGLSRYLLGSVTERVIRNADAPVLVVTRKS